MILSTFTEKEMMKEFLIDQEHVINVLEKKYLLKWRRTVIKSKVFPIEQKLKIVTPRNNTFIISMVADSKKTLLNTTFMGCLIHYNNGYGMLASSTINNNSDFGLYIPHFFARYKQRLNLDLSGIEIINHFFVHNSITNIKHFKKEGYSDGNFIAISKEGFQLGEKTKLGNAIFKTFVSPDMFSSTQQEIYKNGKKGLLCEFDTVQKCISLY